MSNTLGVSFTFRYDPNLDGSLKVLAENGLPTMGYLCAWDGSQYWWDTVWFQTYTIRYDGRPDQPATLRTQKTFMVDCPVCQTSEPWPAGFRNKDQKDGEDCKCPRCGERAGCRQLKPGSDEFFDVLGDLRDDLEQSAKSAMNSGLMFEWPHIYVGYPNPEAWTVEYEDKRFLSKRKVRATPCGYKPAVDLVAARLHVESPKEDVALLKIEAARVVDEALSSADGKAATKDGKVTVTVKDDSDKCVPGKAAANALNDGHVLKLMESVPSQELRIRDGVSVSACPELAFGYVDADDARKGIRGGGGLLSTSLKLFLPEERRVHQQSHRY